MRRVDSFEKTLMLWKIEGRRRIGQQRMRWLGSITDSLNMSWENSRRWWRQGRLACCSPWSYKKSYVLRYTHMCIWKTLADWSVDIVWCNCACVLSCFSCIQLSGDPVDCSLLGPFVHGVSSGKNTRGGCHSSPGDLPDPGIEPMSLMSPILAGRFFTTVPAATVGDDTSRIWRSQQAGNSGCSLETIFSSPGNFRFLFL